MSSLSGGTSYRGEATRDMAMNPEGTTGYSLWVPVHRKDDLLAFWEHIWGYMHDKISVLLSLEGGTFPSARLHEGPDEPNPRTSSDPFYDPDYLGTFQSPSYGLEKPLERLRAIGDGPYTAITLGFCFISDLDAEAVREHLPQRDRDFIWKEYFQK